MCTCTYVRNVTLHLIHCRKFSATLEVLYGTVQYRIFLFFFKFLQLRYVRYGTLHRKVQLIENTVVNNIFSFDIE